MLENITLLAVAGHQVSGSDEVKRTPQEPGPSVSQRSLNPSLKHQGFPRSTLVAYRAGIGWWMQAQGGLGGLNWPLTILDLTVYEPPVPTLLLGC